MQNTPKSMRLQIALFGRTNVGKSSFLNLMAGQDIAITSTVPGTTTDVVEKPMEMIGVGPVVFLDTAGLDDKSVLGKVRIQRTIKTLDRADIITLVCEAGVWTESEEMILAEAKKLNRMTIVVVNKIDLEQPSEDFLKRIRDDYNVTVVCADSSSLDNRDEYLNKFKQAVIENCPADYIKPPALLADLVPKHGLVVLLIPIDVQAPKGRIILPQVQAVRDCLDADCASLIVKENDYVATLAKLNVKPDLVVCDSQVVDFMVANTPEDVDCTTFSIIFSRLKGDMKILDAGTQVIDKLVDGDKILIAETCTHHATCDDIGRVKIPRWLAKYTKKELTYDVCAGRDYPEDLKQYKLIVHCGSCMINRQETLSRIVKAVDKNVPITNYGMCISYCNNVYERVLAPFHKNNAL